MPFQTSTRMNHFQTGIFSELATYKKEKEQDMIDVSVGSPDLPPSKELMSVLAENIGDPKQYGYTLKGIDAFHNAVASYYQSQFDVTLDPQTDILQLMGSQDGLVHLPLVMTNPGDTILVPDPGYPAYEAGVALAQAEPYPMALKKENNFLPDLTAIPEQIAKKAKMMFLNFPGNPVPALASVAFFRDVVAFAKKYDILVVHDFAYSELIFDGLTPTSFLQIDGAKDIGVEFNSLSKSFNIAGARIGYVVGHPQVVETLGVLKSNLDYGVFAPVQKAAVYALENGNDFLRESRNIYERRRDVLVNGLHDLGWYVDRPQASMFIWAEIPKGWTSNDFTYALIDEAGVVVTPGSAFGHHGEGFVRIALVQEEKKLKEAVQRIYQSGVLQHH